MRTVIKDWYGENPEISKDYCRIVNNKHMDRLKKMLSMTNGKVVIGGRSNNDDKFLEPTVITEVGLDDAIMQVDFIF